MRRNYVDPDTDFYSRGVAQEKPVIDFNYDDDDEVPMFEPDDFDEDDEEDTEREVILSIRTPQLCEVHEERKNGISNQNDHRSPSSSSSSSSDSAKMSDTAEDCVSVPSASYCTKN